MHDIVYMTYYDKLKLNLAPMNSEKQSFLTAINRIKHPFPANDGYFYNRNIGKPTPVC